MVGMAISFSTVMDKLVEWDLEVTKKRQAWVLSS